MKTKDTWICDSCHQPITDVSHGWVEWLTRNEGGKHIGRGLRLVHHCSAHEPLDGRCQCDVRAERARDVSSLSDLPLTDFVGPDGLITLLSLIADEEVPTEEVLEMIKRLHVPGYEHARFHFDAAIADGVFEPNTRPGYYSIHDINAVLEYARHAYALQRTAPRVTVAAISSSDPSRPSHLFP